MAHINFVIPINSDELVNYNANHYTVSEVLPQCDINKALIVSRRSFRDEGPTYIIQHFDTYFSVIRHEKNLPRSVVFATYEDLRKCILSLPTHFTYMLEEKEISEIHKHETQTVVKMLVYLYIETGEALEGGIDSDDSLLLVKTKRKKDTAPKEFKVNLVHLLETMKVLLQTDLNKFWDPPGVDEIVAGRISEVVYLVLKKPDIKHDHAAQSEMWVILGLLVTEYNLSEGVIRRLVRIVKEHEHAALVLPDGVQQLVEVSQCKGFFTSFVHELAEWQVTEDSTESAASRYCSKLLVELAMRLPQLMIGEVAYLNRYLKSNSIQLRAMVLSVQVEVLIMSYKQTAADSVEMDVIILLRNDVLLRLLRYMSDTASLVRARVFTYVTKLIPHNIIPTSLVKLFLKKGVQHLHDVAGTVRKAASSCITAMLKFNCHGPSLSKRKFTKELHLRQEKLAILKCEILGLDMAKLEDLEREWQEVHLKSIKERILDYEFSDEEDEGNQENEEIQPPVENNANCSMHNGILNSSRSSITERAAQPDTPANESSRNERMRDAILAKDYTLAVRLCRETTKNSATFKELRKRNDAVNDLELMPLFMHYVYSNTPTSNRQPTAEELEELATQEHSVDSFTEVVAFLEQMTEAMRHMRELLNSTSINDMHVAVDFIIACSQFHLDEATDGIIAILQIMGRNEQDRRKVVLEAMRTVFLVTDSTNLIEHTSQVVDRLIELMQNVSYATLGALSTLLSEWAVQGTLGNDIIDALWQQVLLNVPSTKNRARAALALLRMTAAGRFSIVEKNYRIVAHVGFGERGISDLRFAEEALHFILMLGQSGGSVNNEFPEFRIASTEPLWKELHLFIKQIMSSKSPFLRNVLSGTVRVILKLHSMPFPYMEIIAKEVLRKVFVKDKSTMRTGFNLVEYNIILGEIAVSILHYLDNDIYTELKRRQYVKLQLKNKKKDVRTHSQLTASIVSAKNRSQARNNTSISTVDLNSTNRTSCEDSMMDGADAVDDDAEYISYVLEHALDESTALGKLFRRGLRICQTPDRYNNQIIQSTAVTALLRGMLLSSTFCEKHIRFIIIVLVKSKVVQNKLTILLHISDLLERYPNVVEPYTIKLYTLLEDPSLEVREMTLKILSLLILKDMIRPQGDIWRLAACIVDVNSDISDMARCFFVNSAHKSNNLYNYMPDIFSHLCVRFPANDNANPPVSNDHLHLPIFIEHVDPPIANGQVSPSIANGPECNAIHNDTKLEMILKYLFSLIDKTKQVEILVERFCLKYEHATDESLARRITFALSLLPYNDRAIQKLIDNFAKYKHFVLDDIVYSHFKTIISANKSKETKGLTSQLEELIKDMFTLDGRAPKVAKAVFKKPISGPKKTANKVKNTTSKARRVAEESSSEEDDDDEFPRTRRRSKSTIMNGNTPTKSRKTPTKNGKASSKNETPTMDIRASLRLRRVV